MTREQLKVLREHSFRVLREKGAMAPELVEAHREYALQLILAASKRCAESGRRRKAKP